jgi:hypothetical protein
MPRRRRHLHPKHHSRSLSTTLAIAASAAMASTDQPLKITHPIFLIPEITELILAHLDMRTLLVSATRVCQCWNSLISTSSTLQRALFYDADDDFTGDELGWDPLASDDCDGSPRRPRFNPLLLQMFGGCFFDFGELHHFVRRAESFYMMPSTPKPHSISSHDDHRYGRDYFLLKPEYENDEDCRRALEDRQRFTRPNASWRRMLVLQPPPRHLGVLRWDPDDPWERPEKVEIALLDKSAIGGLRMGELYDFVQHELCYPRHSEKERLWFRMAWGRQPIIDTSHLHQQRQVLFAQTNVIVEFFEMQCLSYGELKDPENKAEFNAQFRCQDARVDTINYALVEGSTLHYYNEGDPLEFIIRPTTWVPMPLS